MGSGRSLLYRSATPVIDAKYEIDCNKTPTESIIDAVATAAGTEPISLSPLYETIDPDAIDRIFERAEEIGDAETVLSFEYEGWQVFVRADGRIRVCDASKQTEPTPVFEGSTSYE